MEQKNGGNSFAEKRACRRFGMKDLIAFAYMGPDIKALGKLINISKGGLQLEYIFGMCQTNNLEKVDLFVLGRKFHINDLSCRCVYDIPLKYSDNGLFQFSIATRRCGIKFDNPTDIQRKQLEIFIEKFF